MKTIVLGAGSGIENLNVVSRPTPRPGPGEVLLRMRAAALNYRDLEIVAGTYFVPLERPLVPLSDGVGEVVELGAGATSLVVGDRVAATFWDHWYAGDSEAADHRTTLGGPLDGMLREYVVLPERRLVRVPQHLSDEEAATLPCAGVTAWQALITVGRLAPGQTVLVQGTGGVSSFALQFAALSGARAIVTSRSDEKLVRAQALGATETVNRTRFPEWHAEVTRLTAGRGVDQIVDVAGPSSFAQSLSALRLGGQLHIVGYLGGPHGAVSPLQILMARAIVRATAVGSRASFEAMNRALEAACIRPVVDRVFEFSRYREAWSYMQSGSHFGKVVIRF
jgi:NADPH:quinone reductase-like Zn-dependent oxidoreductase